MNVHVILMKCFHKYQTSIMGNSALVIKDKISLGNESWRITISVLCSHLSSQVFVKQTKEGWVWRAYDKESNYFSPSVGRNTELPKVNDMDPFFVFTLAWVTSLNITKKGQLTIPKGVLNYAQTLCRVCFFKLDIMLHWNSHQLSVSPATANHLLCPRRLHHITANFVTLL